MLRRLLLGFLLVIGLVAGSATAEAATRAGSVSDTYSSQELVSTGSAFFGSVAQGMASLVERAVSNFGLPNGYILGEEAGGAIIGGVRYGQGVMYTRNAGDMSVYWQGPTLGLDLGGDGSKVMMLVYDLNSVNDVFGRYPGVDGSAYVVGGLAMSVLKRDHVVMVPIRSGVGARLGINVGYLKFTNQPTWNPF
jgi:hypothetical protein